MAFGKVLFAHLFLTAFCSQDEPSEDSIKVYPQVYEGRQDNSEKVLAIGQTYSLILRKASVLANSLLLLDVTEHDTLERYVQGAYYERHLYEDTRKQASLILKPVERGVYHIVSLRLQQLEPPVRIGLAAVEGLKLNPDGDLIGDRTLDDLIEYVNNNEVPKKSDLVYMSTGLDIKYGTDPSKYVSLAGITTTGQACRTDKVAIGQDTPDTFSGVQTAAHEIAHLLGAPHDGEGDAKNCSSQDGYIMSTHEGGKNGLTFSDCTKKAVAQFFQKPGSECLRKEILCYVISLPNKAADLPGDVMDGPTFCSKYYPKGKYKSSTYIKVDSDLNQCLFRCLVESKRLPRRAMNVTPFAVDGTPCSQSEPRKVCKSRICVEP